MRFLYLSLNVPFPADNGHRMRTWSTLRALKAEGHETTLLCLAPDAAPDPDTVALKEGCDAFEVVLHASRPLSVSADYAGRLRALLAARPYTARRWSSPALQARVASLLTAERFDAAVCDTIFMTENVRSNSVPIIVNSPDVEHVVLARFLAHEHNPLRRAYATVELSKTRRWERTVCRRGALVLAASATDQDVLETLCPETRVAVLPNVIDIEHYAPAPNGDPSIILYSGGMDWYPNRDAVDYFARQVFPALRRSFPNLRFRVAGRASDAFRQHFIGMAGVEFTGYVPDMRVEIARAGLCVVPIRIGSGTRLKILEAAAMSKAIVSTSVGAEGLDFVDGSEIVLADGPAALVGAVTVLLGDPARRRSLGQAARRRVEASYGTTALQQALSASLAGWGMGS